MTQINIANSYIELSELRDKEENLRLAIYSYKEAMSFYTKQDYPDDYAKNQKILALFIL